jgi:hypothetical protein
MEKHHATKSNGLTWLQPGNEANTPSGPTILPRFEKPQPGKMNGSAYFACPDSCMHTQLHSRDRLLPLLAKVEWRVAEPSSWRNEHPVPPTKAGWVSHSDHFVVLLLIRVPEIKGGAVATTLDLTTANHETRSVGACYKLRA